MNRSVAAFSLARTLRTSGLAEFIAPSRPLGRLASALALTALLAGVQLTLGLANAGSSLCRLAGGGCAFAIPAPRGSASPPAAAPQPAPDRTRPTSTTAATVGGPAQALQTVVYRTPPADQPITARVRPTKVTASTAVKHSAAKKATAKKATGKQKSTATFAAAKVTKHSVSVSAAAPVLKSHHPRHAAKRSR